MERSHFLSGDSNNTSLSNGDIGGQENNEFRYEQQQQQNMTDLGFQLGAVLESLFDNVDRNVNNSGSPLAPVMSQEGLSGHGAESSSATMPDLYDLDVSTLGDSSGGPDSESQAQADAQAEMNAQIAAQQASGKPTTKRSNIPCVYFGVPGKKCYSGSKCQFLHEDRDVSSRPCTYFGVPGKKCFAGEKCIFLHAAPSAVAGKSVSDASARSASGDEDEEADQKDSAMSFVGNGEVIPTAAKPGQKKICFPFNSKRGCSRGANCQYLHALKTSASATGKADSSAAEARSATSSQRMFRYCDYVSPAGTACKLECAEGSSSCRMHATKPGYASTLVGGAASGVDAAASAALAAAVEKKGKAEKVAKNKWCTYVSANNVKCRLSCAEDHPSLCKMHAHQAADRLREQEATKLKAANKAAGKKGVAAVTATASAIPAVGAATVASDSSKNAGALALRQLVGQTLLGMLVNEQDAGCRLAFGKLLKLLNENTPWVLSTIDQAAGTPDINIHQLINALLTMVNVMSIA